MSIIDTDTVNYMGTTPDDLRWWELDEVDPKKIDAFIDQHYPGLLSVFYPRKYSAPGGYPSPKIPARVFALHCHPKFIRASLDGELLKGVDANVFASGESLAFLRVPTYWVTRELADAASHTSPPETLKLADIKFPLDAMLFMLPEGTLDPPGQRASWVSITRRNSRDGGKMVCFVCGGQGPTYSTLLKDSEPLSQFDSLDFECPHPMTGEHIGELVDPNDRKFTRRMCHLGITLLMLMSARPELVLVETPHDAPVREDGRADRNKLFRPNWIGSGYRVARKSEEAAFGTHASPVMHWRRGHWRHQPCGPNRSERKDIWIEPCLVSAPEDETSV